MYQYLEKPTGSKIREVSTGGGGGRKKTEGRIKWSEGRIITEKEIEGRGRWTVEARLPGSMGEKIGGGGDGYWCIPSGTGWISHRRKIHATGLGINRGVDSEGVRGDKEWESDSNHITQHHVRAGGMFGGNSEITTTRQCQDKRP